MARQVRSIGALLVIFAAGVLGTRLGARRVMVWCGATYAVGSVIVAVAQPATSEEPSSQFTVPIEEVDQIDDMQRNACMAGFQAQGSLRGALTLLAAAMFFVIRRRQESGVFRGAPEAEVGAGQG